MSWLPIETAPKAAEGDGSAILLALPAVGALKDPRQRRVFEGRWNETQQTWTSVNGYLVLSAATHWMPLPAPPEDV